MDTFREVLTFSQRSEASLKTVETLPFAQVAVMNSGKHLDRLKSVLIRLNPLFDHEYCK